MANPTNTDDVIDSRNIIERIEELEGYRAELIAELDEAVETIGEGLDGVEADLALEARDAAQQALEAWKLSDESKELAALLELQRKAKGISDWDFGETLIRDSYFTDYAQQLAEETGAIDDNARWPCTCIDWEKAASELQMDYSSVEFDGVTYWVRD